MRMNANGQLCIGYTGANCTGSNSLITSGNVGIGTTGPGYNLHVKGRAGEDGAITVDTSQYNPRVNFASLGVLKSFFMLM